MEWVIGFAVLFVLAIVWALMRDSERESEITSELRKAFDAVEEYARSDCGIAYDPHTRRLKVAERKMGHQIVSAVLGEGDVLEAAIYDSGTVVAHSGGSLGGALVGGVAVGLSGHRRTKMSVDVSLQIVATDPERPSWTVTFADLSEAKSNLADPIRRAALKRAREWYGIATALRESRSEPRGAAADQGDSAGEPPALGDDSTLAQAMLDLARMHDTGLITDDQYRQLTQQLLHGGTQPEGLA